MPDPQPATPSGAPRAPERPLAQRRVAIIAVHGVAHHPPGETENAVADLLLSLSHNPVTGAVETRHYDDPRAFESFRDVSIQIPLQRLRVDSNQLNTASSENKSHYQEQSAKFADSITRTASPQPGTPANQPDKPLGDIAQKYTGTLLEDYEGGADSNAYITTRLEGRRAHDLTDVDIYEVLWADLAKPYNTFLKFFVATFQLLFHLATLSRIVLDTGANESNTRTGNAFRFIQRLAVRIFQIYVPVTHLLLLIAVVSCFSAASSVTNGEDWLPLLLGTLGGIGAGYAVLTRPSRPVPANPWAWSGLMLLPPLLGAALTDLVLALLRHIFTHPGTSALQAHQLAANIVAAILIWMLPGAGLLYFAFSSYEDARPGVSRDGWVMYAGSLALFLLFFQSSWSTGQASFWTAKILLGAVRLSWAALILTALAAFLLGTLTIRQQALGSDLRARTVAAVRCSRFTLALPCALFLLFTMVLWSATFALSAKLKLPNYTRTVVTEPLPWTLESKGEAAFLFPPAQDILCEDAPAKPPSARIRPAMDRLTLPTASPVVSCPEGTILIPAIGERSGAELWNSFTWALGPELPITLGLLSLSVFLIGAWVLPSAITERFPPRTPPSATRGAPAQRRRRPAKPHPLAPRDTTTSLARFMGAWLSAGLDATAVITLILFAAIFVAPLVVLLVTRIPQIHHLWEPFARLISGSAVKPGDHQRVLIHLTKIIVVTNAAAAVALIAGVVRDGGSLLGIVLDVDTYLRMSPIEATPRAKIFERYISTLRYVEGYRDAQGKGYDSIVIFSHSLGALISGDILHFLQSPYSAEPPLQNTDIRLITVGNPVRQLLNRFFPYLYDWISPQPDNALEPLHPPDPDPPPHLPPGHPDARRLGVTHWANAYRSGDYVGRQLWLDAWYQRTPDPTPANPLPGNSAPHSSRSRDWAHPAQSPTVISSLDQARHELCIGAGAHTHYMDDTAPDVAWLLDRLIDPMPIL